ncbi:hypothetical protein GCM10025868_32320 [Angustibacter aerolatus]|uniref:Carbohydrate kinase PfkB domain-containing protein n=1 Tax=Angustibacter aerolatus TaxID=1162965 RepID=A0ABQ6JJP0_9ACTN|nr:PfkB family carbohydrate kinase [Angustibacter aerolatus]GMA87982.1 hypothetical protein GCM10025868_32320 [Angustibacter aerolatus]
MAGAVRSNVSLVEADGRTTKVNEPGPTLAPDEVAALLDAARASSARGEWVVWAGSLPGGFSPQRLADAVADARAAGRRVALDCSGQALVTALSRDGEQPAAPGEAERRGASPSLAGRPLPTLGDVLDVAGDLVRRGVRTVLVSLGGDGAVLVDADLTEPLHGRAQAGAVVNTVGAGDAFLAGWLAAADGGAAPADALAAALRSGAAAVEHEGTLLGTPDPRRPVSIGPVHRDQPVAAH